VRMWLNVAPDGLVVTTNPNPLYPILKVQRRGNRYYFPTPFSVTPEFLNALVEKGILRNWKLCNHDKRSGLFTTYLKLVWNFRR